MNANETRPRKRKPATHTPGPWTFDDCGDGQILITPADDPCLYIADINSKRQDPEGRYPVKAAREANARLISEAPAMLAALVDIVKCWESGDLAAAVRQGADLVTWVSGREG